MCMTLEQIWFLWLCKERLELEFYLNRNDKEYFWELKVIVIRDFVHNVFGFVNGNAYSIDM